MWVQNYIKIVSTYITYEKSGYLPEEFANSKNLEDFQIGGFRQPSKSPWEDCPQKGPKRCPRSSKGHSKKNWEIWASGWVTKCILTWDSGGSRSREVCDVTINPMSNKVTQVMWLAYENYLPNIVIIKIYQFSNGYRYHQICPYLYSLIRQLGQFWLDLHNLSNHQSLRIW